LSTDAGFAGIVGWDEYARYYDWENARTMGMRDLAFWRRMVSGASGPVIELGCGTGRVLLKTSGVVSAEERGRKRHPRSVGIDRSAPMLDIARQRARKLRPAVRPVLIRADIRALPIATGSAALVIAPYGILQSLVRDIDLTAALAESARVLRSGGQFVVDLVPDLPRWPPYRGRVRMQGSRRAGTTVTLVESVRQDKRRKLTIFDETFFERPVERTNGRRVEPVTRRFSLTFRTLPLAETRRRFVRAGFTIDAVFGGYRGQKWTPRSETWLIVARK
jgi:ubiquinone/menaquinone biosynthesis C-methylase UbiE